MGPVDGDITLKSTPRSADHCGGTGYGGVCSLWFGVLARAGSVAVVGFEGDDDELEGFGGDRAEKTPCVGHDGFVMFLGFRSK